MGTGGGYYVLAHLLHSYSKSIYNKEWGSTVYFLYSVGQPNIHSGHGLRVKLKTSIYIYYE